MSLKLALKALERLGLKDVDAQVYIYLAKKGPRGENDLTSALKLTKRQLCLSLESLLIKGMVTASPEHLVKYSAIELEKILDQIMQTKKEQTMALQASKRELLSVWRSFVKKGSSDS